MSSRRRRRHAISPLLLLYRLRLLPPPFSPLPIFRIASADYFRYATRYFAAARYAAPAPALLMMSAIDTPLPDYCRHFAAISRLCRLITPLMLPPLIIFAADIFAIFAAAIDFH